MIDEALLRRHLLFDAATIATAVDRLAADLLASVAGDVTVLGILEGARPFTLDLLACLRRRAPERRIELAWLRASSYRGGTSSSGVVDVGELPVSSIERRAVVLLDDIIDEGHTLAAVARGIEACGPAVLRICVLLDKPCERARAIEPDFVGMRAPSAFIVGYGLDFQEKFRELPYLAAVQPSVLE